MQRIKREWGGFNGTDDDTSDEPRWGFQTFKKLGKIVLGLAKEDLRELPIRGIEDVLEVLGGNKGWSRGQVIQMFYYVAQVTSGNITRCDWLLTWEDFSVMTVGIMKIVNAL